jgi:protein-S-isoprenylcysteine O-methyltransferase Ste14
VKAIVLMFAIYLFIGAIYIYVNSSKLDKRFRSTLTRDDVIWYQFIVAGIMIAFTYPIFVLVDKSFIYKD